MKSMKGMGAWAPSGPTEYPGPGGQGPTCPPAFGAYVYALDRAFNFTPFHSSRIFKLDFVCAIIELLISIVY